MSDLDNFLLTYASTPGRVVLDLDMDKWEGEHSPFIVVRFQGRVMILNPMALKDHLCVDAHAFIDGEDARTGVFGMEIGRRVTFAGTEGTSHGWPATKLVALLLGEQA